MPRFKKGHNLFRGIGRLTVDPEYGERTSKKGSQYTTMAAAIAINPWGRVPRQGWRKDTLFLQLRATGKVAEYIRDVARAGCGDQVDVTGHLENRNVTKEGVTVMGVVLVVSELFLQAPSLSSGESRDRGALQPKFDPDRDPVDPFGDEG